jgi:hypothetical protein
VQNLNKPISIKELELAIKNSKSYTAPRVSGIPPEIWKQLSKEDKVILLTVFNDIFSSGITPEPWKISAFMLLEKDISKNQFADQYKPIALLDTLYKI